MIYYKDNILQTLGLDDRRLLMYPIKRLEYVEGQLRSKGFRTEIEWKSVERIYSYRMNILVARGMDLQRVKRIDPFTATQPKMPVESQGEARWWYRRKVAENEFEQNRKEGEVFRYEAIPNFIRKIPEFDKVDDSFSLVLIDPTIIKYVDHKKRERIIDAWSLSYLTSSQLELILD